MCNVQLYSRVSQFSLNMELKSDSERCAKFSSIVSRF